LRILLILRGKDDIWAWNDPIGELYTATIMNWMASNTRLVVSSSEIDTLAVPEAVCSIDHPLIFPALSSQNNAELTR